MDFGVCIRKVGSSSNHRVSWFVRAPDHAPSGCAPRHKQNVEPRNTHCGQPQPKERAVSHQPATTHRRGDLCTPKGQGFRGVKRRDSSWFPQKPLFRRALQVSACPPSVLQNTVVSLPKDHLGSPAPPGCRVAHDAERIRLVGRGTRMVPPKGGQPDGNYKVCRTLMANPQVQGDEAVATREWSTLMFVTAKPPGDRECVLMCARGGLSG